uniref:Methylthioribose-1-phosphate isomerase n=1 Tax=Phallusia mammillata TaxID=59560 RepID=A0A6F9DLD5_9ASCI|nr:methylthioribose-1-phosphate isomerase-like [Phallusia mammillata]
MTLEAIKYHAGSLQILDQLLLPHKSHFVDIRCVEDGWKAIKTMQVRGAPAIAIVGCLSFAVELKKKKFETIQELTEFSNKSLNYLVTARPTAVNMSKSAKMLSAMLSSSKCDDVEELKQGIIDHIEDMLDKDIQDNKDLSNYAAEHIQSTCNKSNDGYTILTHCNTGFLATAGYGTALGVVRSLHKEGLLDHVYCTETRPYNQGARLTAYELVHDELPSTLIADSMVAVLMKTRKISAVVVGADRVAVNGDVANKIGTYQIAVLAKHHNVPFYVAAPVTCHDDIIQDGNDITIEERPADELTMVSGVRVAAKGINCWNPAFDVTPAKLITGGIATELGVFAADEVKQLKNQVKNGSKS